MTDFIAIVIVRYLDTLYFNFFLGIQRQFDIMTGQEGNRRESLTPSH